MQRDNIFLTIDYQNFNSYSPPKYQIGAKNAHEQFCYFNQRKRDKFCKNFLTMQMLFQLR